MRPGAWTRAAVIGIALTFLIPTGAAVQADDDDEALYIAWPDLTPTLTAGYDPSSDNECKAGAHGCIHAVLGEMDRRFRPLCDECDHNAIFALLYLRTTEEYHDYWHEGHFDDPRFMNHYAAVFANYYFRQYDDWYGGNKDRVSPAWRHAFEAADNREVTGTGNMFLGMNAHINRDLPFVLEAIGLIAPDGSSRKPDHNRVNEFLARVGSKAMPEAKQRFDPTIRDDDDFISDLSFQIIPAWREQAWRNAECLKEAGTSLERDLIAAEIEAMAELEAEAIRAAYSYELQPHSAEQRDAYCAENNWNTG